MAKLTMRMVRASLREVGITIRRDREWSEYIVRVVGSPEGEGYHTSDLADAYQTGHAMAQDDPRAKKAGETWRYWQRIRAENEDRNADAYERAKRDDERMLGLPRRSIKA